MANIIVRPSWYLPERFVTPEHAFVNRRKFLRQLGVAGAGAMSLSAIGCRESTAAEATPAVAPKQLATVTPSKSFPAPRHPDFNADWKLSEEEVTATYNNFYEFTLQKDVHRHVGKFTTDPWSIDIGGLCDNPMKISPQELVTEFGLEERVYRFRCVEAWAMIVPWTGFQFSKLIAKAKPKPEAKFIRMLTASKPDQMPGMSRAPRAPSPRPRAQTPSRQGRRPSHPTPRRPPCQRAPRRCAPSSRGIGASGTSRMCSRCGVQAPPPCHP